MKKYINLSFIYAIIALISGVFYREFTKFNDFTGTTTLSILHTHLFILGMFLFLILAIMVKQLGLQNNKKLKYFDIIYNAGLILTVIMFAVRGVMQVLEISLSKGGNAAISGFAGIGHILLSIGIILFFAILRDGCKETY